LRFYVDTTTGVPQRAVITNRSTDWKRYVLKKLEHADGAESFDLIFIDADETNYDRHYEAAIYLVRSGGLIILDNMLHLGRVPDSDHNDAGTVSIRALNQKIAEDERVDRVILSIGDGVTLVRRR
jgi:O-methyltransferase